MALIVRVVRARHELLKLLSFNLQRLVVLGLVEVLHEGVTGVVFDVGVDDQVVDLVCLRCASSEVAGQRHRRGHVHGQADAEEEDGLDLLGEVGD